MSLVQAIGTGRPQRRTTCGQHDPLLRFAGRDVRAAGRDAQSGRRRRARFGRGNARLRSLVFWERFSLQVDFGAGIGRTRCPDVGPVARDPVSGAVVLSWRSRSRGARARAHGAELTGCPTDGMVHLDARAVRASGFALVSPSTAALGGAWPREEHSLRPVTACRVPVESLSCDP